MLLYYSLSLLSTAARLLPPIAARPLCSMGAASSPGKPVPSMPYKTKFYAAPTLRKLSIPATGNTQKFYATTFRKLSISATDNTQKISLPANAKTYRYNATLTYGKLSINAIVHTPHDSPCIQAIEELPPKLQNIIRLFEGVQEPRAKYEQLLHYRRKITPLGKEFQTKENKVEGCVSQVWVRAFFDKDNKVYFQAESDSVLTKGLAALLVEGLSGCSPAEILKVSPDFIQMLGLRQSMTPSRNNGFLNMLKLMQRKVIELHMEAERGESLSIRRHDQHIDVVGQAEEKALCEVGSSEMGVVLTRADRIRKKLEAALEPTLLEIEDVSYQNAGHEAVQGESKETHFKVKIVSNKFEERSRVKRHRLVYDLLQEELHSGLHALSILAKTPSEVDN